MELHVLSPLLTAVSAIAGGAIGYVLVRKSAASIVSESEKRAETILDAARIEAEAMKKAATAEALEAVRQDREELEKNQRNSNEAIRRREEKLDRREEDTDRARQRLEKKEESLEVRRVSLDEQEKELESKSRALADRSGELDAALERTARLSAEEAKAELLSRVEETAKMDAAGIARRIEEEAKENAETEAQKIVALAVQRFSGEYIAERTVTVVQLNDDKMKGRIIGREGRNIRAFEMITGVDLVVDDTPETVIISCHNPLRREIARLTLEKLMEDGRIQPGRIEEIYQGVTGDTERNIREAGQQAVFDLGIQGLHTELVRLMGINKFRTSYSQNVLLHSSEVSYICGIMADEMGLDRNMARRVGFLHDIGKAVDQEFEGSHADIGADLLKKFGESEEVVRAVREHHDDPPSTIWGVMIQAADTLSAARPGARRETVTNYIKRMEELEEIATRRPEVNKAYAIQSGRELRIILDSERSTDDGAFHLAKSVAAEIEAVLTYPGQIKVTVLRELRATAFAK